MFPVGRRTTNFLSSLLWLSAAAAVQVHPAQAQPQAPAPHAAPQEEVEQTPDDPESNSSSDEPADEDGIPASDTNPLNPAGNSIDALIQKGINADLWQQMKGNLPCVDATTECINQLQQLAAQHNPLLKEVDARIEEIQQKISEANAQNKKSINLSVLRPAAQVFLQPTFDTQVPVGQRQRGPIDKLISLFSSPMGVINEVLRAVGIPLFDKLLSNGNDQAQSRSIAIADLQVKLAEIQRSRAELADKVNEKVSTSVFDFDTSRSQFQISQEIAKREASRVYLSQVEYRLGINDSVTYLGQLSGLDRNKAATWTSWTSMRSQLAKIQLLVLGTPE